MKLSKKHGKENNIQIINEQENFINDNITNDNIKNEQETNDNITNEEVNITNEQEENQEDIQLRNDLEAFNTLNQKMFIAKFSSVDDCTESLIYIIKNIQPLKIDKLIRQVLKLPNFKIDEIQKLTVHKNRAVRLTSTKIVYAYIISRYKDCQTSNINNLFKNTFLRRFKDVDQNIRACSYEFLISFIQMNPKLFNKHKSMISNALKDKSDSVRKSTILEMRKHNFLLDENVIKELAIWDKNKIIRMEATNLIFEHILNGNYEETLIFEILKSNQGSEKFFNKDFNLLLGKVFDKLLKKDLFDTVHKIISLCVDYVDQLDVQPFKCECSENCYLLILAYQKKSLTLSEIVELYQNNLNSLNSITGLLLYADINNTDILIKFLDNILHNISHKNDLKQFDRLCQFFKKIENDYKSVVESVINKVFGNRDYKNVVIKYFDIEECVTDEDYLETHVYKNLWDVINEDYGNLTRITNKKYDIYSKFNLCELVLYVKTQLSVEDGKFDISNLEEKSKSVCYDKKTALKIIYYDLLQIVDIDDKELLDFMYRFLEEGILEEKHYLIYKYVKNINEFSEIFSKSKNKANYVVAFFRFLSVFDKDVYNIAKIINSKFRDTEKRLLFKNIKSLVEISANYKCLEVFVNRLSITECIVIENICKESKFKDLLNKKIERVKMLKNTSEEKVTYL